MPTCVVPELRRRDIEKRFAPRKIDIEVQRFDVNSGKYDIIKFLNEMRRSEVAEERTRFSF